ncbi:MULTISPECIES: 5'/3'-nucleotidase SurE [Methanobacterium]|uniref:5'-nucleotidase SurE n=1 Tax=Methanobacterium subterraneum TaxID=59277 RepID=A0A2H4VAW1_9EURY|nr:MULTISPECIES: 5'/3'-nucleotidase SurE [Methanobacterium]MBW4256357.1 5'/3'-nucleotidase SurE [Methanobacterium sp. YSL]PKL72969.1 MAG: 5'/3'-nucleotidase SurE [Methanobacteriales archaeon HGW-Methanobacteriales-2]AUB55234.1 5'/3'-nucleotidase SurE [Methanobacterium subterraneum]AUB57778.1 5'/3'-nucleotidase SurE [Methanobacterium sp. MZ-A1]NMO09976.1 5'/3'-nucleotidase SurE [Methanobacterium subterraneum]
MTILITNDDGVNSSGIIAAKKAAEKLGETLVVAPATQQSGIGHALTLFEPIRVTNTHMLDGGEAYMVSGTPTDALIIGIFQIADKKPDLVISGINIGENLGKSELTTSGTIGAAMEAAVHGIPALSVSLQVTRGDIKFHDGHVDIDFSHAQKMTERVARMILKNGLPDGVDFLNLNIPSHPDGDCLKFTRLGDRMYRVHIKERLDPRGRPYYWIDGDSVEDDEVGTDVHTLKRENCATVTPISLDATASLENMIDWLD